MDRLSAIPNAFHDLLVFIVPTVLLAIGVALGFGEAIDPDDVLGQSLGGWEVLGLLSLLLVLSYEYGRAAEAWSAKTVQLPARFLNKHFKLFSHDTSLLSIPDVNETLSLEVKVPTEHAHNRWTYYMYAYAADPVIGADLLKRYAWEKLTRNSAFTYQVLTVASIGYGFVAFFWSSVELPHKIWGFGSLGYSAATFVLSLAAMTEYRRRVDWNADLIAKVAPVLAEIGIPDGRQGGASD